jgi:hypothetical protein
MTDHAIALLSFLVAVMALVLGTSIGGGLAITLSSHPDRAKAAKACFTVGALGSLVAAYFFWSISSISSAAIRVSVESIWVVATFVGLFAGFRFANRSLIKDSVPEPKTFDTSNLSFELTGLNFERCDDGTQFMLPRFTYNTGLGVSPEIEVKANLEVWDDDSLRMKEYPGVWYDSKSRSKRFTSGDSANLILGLVSDEGMVAHEYSALTVSGVNLGSKLTELKGKRFYVRVAFIARTDKDVLFEPTKWFGVEAGPKPQFVGLLKPPSNIW